MKKLFLKVSLFSLILLTQTFIVYGQGEANVWYFGEKFGLNFNTTPPTVLTNGSNTTSSAEGEGTASICDASGNLLFYSDGSNLYKGNHALLTAVASNRNISQNVIVPDPGNSGRYYFIHPWATDATSNLVQGLKYSIISATTSSDAAVVSLNQTFPGSVANISQALTVIPNNTNTGYWIVSHEANSAKFKVWSLTSGGIAFLSDYAFGFTAAGTIAMLKANSCSNAIAISYYNSTKVQVLSFNNTTGAVTGLVHDVTNFESSNETYGVEFSPNGNILYVSITGESTASDARLYQFRLDNGDVNLAANRYIVDNTAAPGGAHRNGAVQLGPDQKVYMSIFGDWGSNGGGVSVVSSPDVFDSGCNYTRLAYTNSNGSFQAWPGMGLPPVLRSFISKPATLDIDGTDISTSNKVCQGKTITMQVSVSGGVSNVSWEVNGASAGTGASISYTFNTAGTIPVKVTFTDDCGNIRTSTSNVNVLTVHKPTVTTPTACTASSSAGANTVWYDAATGGNVVGTGTTYAPAVGLLPATFYAEDATPYAGPFTVGHTSLTQQSATYKKTEFNALENITITSVDILPFSNYGAYNGLSVTINLKNSSDATIATKVYTLSTTPGINPPSTPQTVALNFSVPADNGYYLEWNSTSAWNTFSSDTKTTYTNSIISILGDPGATAGSWNGNGPFYNFVVEQTYPCVQRQSVALTPCCAAPAQPSVITGDGTYCLSPDETYSVTNVAGVTYAWTVSGGGTVAATTSNTATINWATAGSYIITVTPSNACTSGPARTLNVTVNDIPAQPSVITGDGTYCLGAENYSVTNVAGITYSWAASTGGTVTPTTTNAATITWTTTGSKTVTVTPSNTCGNGTQRDLTPVTVNDKPAQPSVITGDGTYCLGAENYSVTNVAGVTYTWTASTGGTVTPTTTNAATITWTTTGSKTVTVTPSNTCGNGTQRDLTPVTVNDVPAQPSVITGDGTYCLGTENYSVTNVAGITYAWTASAGGTVTPTTTNAATITWTTTGAKTVTVTPSNTCGNGTQRDLTPVTVNDKPAQPSVITGDGTYCLGAENYSVTNVAGVTYSWAASAGGTVTPTTTNAATITWTTTGSKTVSVTPSNSCGSGTQRDLTTVTVNDAPAQPSVISGNATPCPGAGQPYSVTAIAGTTYTWTLSAGGTVTGSGANATVNWTAAGGPYTLTVVPSNGCGNGTSRTLSVTVNSGTSASVSAITGSNSHCKGSQSYSIVDGGLTYTWSLSGGGSLSTTTGTNVSVNWTSAGPYTLTVTPANACGDGTPSNLNVTVNDNPTITNTNLSQAICTGTASSEVILTSDVAGTTFNWSATPSSGITGYTANASNVNNIASQIINNAGTSQGSVSYLVNATGPTGCPGTGPVIYLINIDPQAIAGVTTTNTQTCSAVQTLPGVQPPSGSVTWTKLSGAGTISNSTLYNSDITGLAAGQSGTFQMTVISGTCSAMSSVVTVARSSDETPSVTLSQPASPICEGTPITFTATGIGGNTSTRTFEFIDASNNTLQAASASNTYTVTAVSNLNVKVKMVANSSCLAAGATQTPGSSIINVVVVPAVQTGLTVTGSQVCAGTNGTVTISLSQLNVSYQGYISGSPVSNVAAGNGGDITLTVPSASLSAATNTISIQAIGCNTQTLSQTAAIEVLSPPVADAGQDISLTSYQTVTLNGTGSSQGSYTYEWTSSDPSASISNSGILTPMVSVNSISTTFYLKVTSSSAGSCFSMDEMRIILDLSVSIPNAFSPNGDGIHDFFVVTNGEYYPNAKMMIYNQWGNLIYESQGGYKEPWDGKKGNTSVDLGTYYYIFDVNQQGVKPMTGSVSIIK